MKILLDYVFPITVITPTPDAATGFLKQALIVVEPNAANVGNVGDVIEATTMAQVVAVTDNLEAQQLFNAGMNKVFVLLADDLDLEQVIVDNHSKFHTILVSSDFTDAQVGGVASSLVKGNLTFTAKAIGAGGDAISIAFITGGTAGSEVVSVVGNAISVSMAGGVSTATQLKAKLDAHPQASALIATAIASGQGATAQTAFVLDNLENGLDAIKLGTFKGVVAVSSDDQDFLKLQAAIPNRVAFFVNSTNKAKNMFFAMGSLLANPSNWLNQQYITMPFNDGVDTLGEANSLFDDKISFVINDDEFGNRLALLAVGKRAIIAPYILKNLRIDLQSRALQWISLNQPKYTLTEAALLETRLQEDVMNAYIARGWIESGTVEITLEAQNFVANGDIETPEPKALWRVVSEMRETV